MTQQGRLRIHTFLKSNQQNQRKNRINEALSSLLDQTSKQCRHMYIEIPSSRQCAALIIFAYFDKIIAGCTQASQKGPLLEWFSYHRERIANLITRSKH